MTNETETAERIDALALIRKLDRKDLDRQIGELDEELKALRGLRKLMPGGQGQGGGRTNWERIAEWLKEHGPAGVAEISDVLGMPKGSVSSAISTHADIFESEGNGQWSIVK